MITLPTHAADPAAYDLAYRVALFLQQQRVATGSHLRIEARGGTVTLRGQVRSFHQRQLVHTLARHVAGVLQVIDELDVEQVVPSSRGAVSSAPLAVLAP